jgi:hypothetical protein
MPTSPAPPGDHRHRGRTTVLVETAFGEARLCFHRVLEGSSVKNRVHLDLLAGAPYLCMPGIA